MDSAQLFILLSIVLFTVKPFKADPVAYAILYTCIVVLVLTVIYTAMRASRAIEKLALGIVFWFKKAGLVVIRLYWYTTLLITNLKRQKQRINYMLLFVAIYALNVLQFFFLLKAAGVAMPVGGLYSAYLVAISMMIIAVVPSAPSNIGVIHYGLYLALIFSAAQHGISTDSQALQSYARFAVYVKEPVKLTTLAGPN